MAIEIKAPAFPSRLQTAKSPAGTKTEGDAVARDELIVEIETDKVVMEVLAPEDGVIAKIHALEGDTVQSEQLLATLEPGAAAATTTVLLKRLPPLLPCRKPGQAPVPLKSRPRRQAVDRGAQARPTRITGTGKGGRITKEDILDHLKTRDAEPAPSKAPRLPPPCRRALTAPPVNAWKSGCR